MFDSVYFLKSTPLRAFTGSYQHLKICYRHIEDVHEMKKFNAEKIFFDKLTGF